MRKKPENNFLVILEGNNKLGIIITIFKVIKRLNCELKRDCIVILTSFSTK